jgi:GntR family transcriptional regulator of arabinose operon
MRSRRSTPRIKAAKSKHRQLFETLRREIFSGRYQPGQKFPSEAALVSRFKVSRITAGRAVHDLREQGLVERFAGSGTYVSRLPEISRGELLFGLIIPDLGATEIFEPICQGIANAPDAGEHALLWPHSSIAGENREEQALELCAQCIARRVSGVFFAPLEMAPGADEVNRRVLADLKKAGIPTVLLDRRPHHMPARDCFDLVSIDNHRAGCLATMHLVKCGACEIGFLAYRGQASSVEARIAGYRQALNSAGHVFYIPAGCPLQLPERAAQCDAFVCSNDRLAGHLMHALLATGVRIPAGIRVVGIDDVTYASLLPVPLTTIRQPCAEIGQTALRMLLERIAHPKISARDVLLDCELVIRESCGYRVTR